MPDDGVRRNELIHAREVRVIGAEGEQLGILQRNEAIAMAREIGCDLVEVSSNATPPVCRIMDYGKFRYQEQKRQQEMKAKQKVIQVKEVKFQSQPRKLRKMIPYTSIVRKDSQCMRTKSSSSF